MIRFVERRISFAALVFALAGIGFAGVFPAAYRTETVDLRGKPQSLAIYDPVGAPHRVQVIVTSGDVGWVGLSVDVAEHVRNKGYRVVGFNARAYLASFTGRNLVLNESDVPRDYAAIMNWATRSAPPAIVLVGVSEGAGLSAMAVGTDQPTRCRGLIALGLPEKTSLGWRWTDFPMWITKKDPKEPMADTRPYMSRLRMPLVMIHSIHDEWDPIDRIKQLYQLAPDPKRFIPIDASNHRFSDRIAEVLDQVDQSLQWIESQLPSKDAP